MKKLIIAAGAVILALSLTSCAGTLDSFADEVVSEIDEALSTAAVS